MNETTPTLFVVDDEPGACKGVAALALSMGVPCETFLSAEEFLDAYDPSRPGCLLIDLRLKGISGIELQERLAAAGSTLSVILISAYADVPTAVKGMQKGAITLLEKPYRDDELADAVRAALEANRTLREEKARHAEVQRRLDSLTDRERRLMEAVLVGRPNRLIARDLGVSQRTVDRLRSSVFEKMHADSAVALVRMVTDLRAFHDRMGQADEPV